MIPLAETLTGPAKQFLDASSAVTATADLISQGLPRLEKGYASTAFETIQSSIEAYRVYLAVKGEAMRSAFSGMASAGLGVTKAWLDTPATTETPAIPA